MVRDISVRELHLVCCGHRRGGRVFAWPHAAIHRTKSISLLPAARLVHGSYIHFIPFAVVKQHNKPVGKIEEKMTNQEWRTISTTNSVTRLLTEPIAPLSARKQHTYLPCPICNCAGVVLEKQNKKGSSFAQDRYPASSSWPSLNGERFVF